VRGVPVTAERLGPWLGELCGRGVVRHIDETELGLIHVHRYPVADASVRRTPDAGWPMH